MAWTSVGNLTSGPAGYTPPTTGWQMCQCAVVGTGSPVSGTAYFVPLQDVGSRALAIQALGLGIVTALVGGTTTTTIGIYPGDGSGGLPDCSAGPTASGTLTVTSTGTVKATVSTTLTPGRWWMAFLYVATAAPTTAMVYNGVSTSTYLMWTKTGTVIGTATRGLSLTGLTALPTAQPSASSWVNVTSASVIPVMAVQAA